METGLRCQVLSSSPTGLIEVVGTLRWDSCPRLREVVLKLSAHAPDAIILDLGGVHDPDYLSATVLPMLGRHVAAVEGELILAAAPPAVRTAVTQTAPTLLRMFPTRQQALHEAARAPTRRRIARHLPANTHAPRATRRLIDGLCTRWHLEQLRGPAEIVGSELITNAVIHAGAPIELRIALRSYVLRIEVGDPSTTRPALREYSPDATTGAGLRIVEALATHWNTRLTPTGKTVWADLLLPASHRPR